MSRAGVRVEGVWTTATAGSPRADGPWRGVGRCVGRPLGTGWGDAGLRPDHRARGASPTRRPGGSVGLSGGVQGVGR